MQLTVTGKQIDIGEALQTHVRDALSTSVSKYFSNPVDVQVVFSREAHGFRADVSVHVGRGIKARGRAPGADPYAAFDGALSHMAKRLRRHKRRLRNHHNNRDKAVEFTEARQYVLGNADNEEFDATDFGGHIIIAEMTTEIQSLTVSEAVMRMDLADSQQLMFRNSAHGGLNIVYRRPDGNIGWIDPRGNRGTL